MKNTIISASLAILAATMISPSAVAQTRFCIGGDLDHMSSNDRAACSATMQAVRTATAFMHAPEGWHFVVVCGEEGWKNYAAFSTHGEAALEEASADTNLDEHVTYFREDRLHTPQAHGLRRVVAHEIASIVLKTDDEDAIQTQMATWERDGQVQQAMLETK